MTDANLGAGLLSQAGLKSGTLPAQEREALWQRIERSRTAVRRLKRFVVILMALLVVCFLTVTIAKNGPHHDEGIRLVLTWIASVGFIFAFYGGIIVLIKLVVQVVSARALEVSARLANMESLMESVAANLNRVAERLEQPAQPTK
jgi:hypothetical protein